MFAHTDVPTRVILTYAQPFTELLPVLKASAASWHDPMVPGLVVNYFDDNAARESLASNFAFHERLGLDTAASTRVVTAWDALIPGAYRADLFRLCEIYMRGGVYADIKCTRRLPLADLVGEHGTVTIDRWDVGAWNGFFAAPPRAPWVLNALQHLLRMVESRALGANHLAFGPGCLGRGITQWLRTDHAAADADADVEQDKPSCAALLLSPAPLEQRGIRVMRFEDGVFLSNGFLGVETENTVYRDMKPKTPEADYYVAYALKKVYRS